MPCKLNFVWNYCLLLSICTILSTSAFKAEQVIRRGSGSDRRCMSPLTNSVEDFPDSAFSASSVLQDRPEFQPHQARLTQVYGSKEHTSGRAWCPSTAIADSLREWIQAEFTHLVLIGAIYTAGRGDGNVKEYMPNFVLKYQREDGGKWYEHFERDQTRVLKANSDPRNPARATLGTMVVAKRIRIYPYSHKSRQNVCLRFALYGCKFPDGIVSYSMPQGTYIRIGQQLIPTLLLSYNFQDKSYDGQRTPAENYLTGGLGQLTDNSAFLGNITTEVDFHPSEPGFHFVGWQRTDRSDIDITFKFDEVRNFTWLQLFTYDSIHLNARLFYRATVSFSTDGRNFGNPVEILTGRAQPINPGNDGADIPSKIDSASSAYNRNNVVQHLSEFQSSPKVFATPEWDGAKVIEIDLKHRVGRFVRLILSPSDTWTLLSEVHFNSTVTNKTSLSLLDSSEPSIASKAESNTGESVSNAKHDTDVTVTQEKGISYPTSDVSSKQQLHPPRKVEYPVDPKINSAKRKPTNEEHSELRASNLLWFTVPLALLFFLLLFSLMFWFCIRKRYRTNQLRCVQQKMRSPNQSAVGMVSHGYSSDTSGLTIQESMKLLGQPFLTISDGQPCLPNGSTQPLTIPPLPYTLRSFTVPKSTCSANQTNGDIGTNQTVTSTSTAPSGISTSTESQPMYAGSDLNGPEYASASICDFPANLIKPSGQLYHTNYNNTLRGAPDYSLFTQCQPLINPTAPTGLSAENNMTYTHPANISAVTVASLQPQNTSHSFPSGPLHQPAGLFFIPQPPGLGQRIGDVPNTFTPLPIAPLGANQAYTIYQTGTMVGRPRPAPNNEENRCFQQLNKSNENWDPSTATEIGSTMMNPLGLPNVCNPTVNTRVSWLAPANLNPALGQGFLHNSIAVPSNSTVKEGRLEQPSISTMISDQHISPNHSYFVPVQQPQTANILTTSNGVQSAISTRTNDDAVGRDGSSSGRLSLYSVCR